MDHELKDELFNLKYQLTNEFLWNGGTTAINSAELLKDILKFDKNDKKTHTSRVMAFFELVYNLNCTSPLVPEDAMPEYRSFLQKELFFEQNWIETEEEVDQLFERYKDNPNYLFRGQREASWRLYNKMQREWILRKNTGKLDYETVLRSMAEKGRTDYEEEIKQTLGKDHVDTTNDLAVMGYLQHHGCPTPLLDWTSCFENALYFAFDGVVDNKAVKEIGDYVSLYFLENKDIVDGGAGALMDESLTKVGNEIKERLIEIIAPNEEKKKEMLERFKDRNMFDRQKIEGAGLVSYMWTVKNLMDIPTGTMYFGENDNYEGIVFSLLNSENIKSQKGGFIFNNSPHKPLEVVAKESFMNDNPDAEEGDYLFCSCYNIHKKLAPYVAKKLKEMGVDKVTIYPDEGIDTTPVFQDCINILNEADKTETT